MPNLYKNLIIRIKKYIAETHLQEGGKLPTESEMCDMFDVSRNVLREALKALQFMGVLEPTPGVGYVVRSFSYETMLENLMYYLTDDSVALLRETRTVRRALETDFFMEAAARLTENDIKKLNTIMCEMRNSGNDIKKAIDADEKFHKTLFKHIENKLFQNILSTAWHAERSVPDGTVTAVELTKQHYGIYLALEQNDHNRALELIKQHFYEMDLKPVY